MRALARAAGTLTCQGVDTPSVGLDESRTVSVHQGTLIGAI